VTGGDHKPGRRPLLLFDWRDGGHHRQYVRRFAECLEQERLIVAAPSGALLGLSSHVESVDLGVGRPAERPDRGMRREATRLAREELALLAGIVARMQPEQILHLYGDGIVGQLATHARRLPPASLCMFYPALHYRAAYDSSLSPREMLRATRLELQVQLWRRRPDALSILALDALAAARWNRTGGARAHWLPEPPIAPLGLVTRERSGALLYGALSRHKGIEAIADALCRPPSPDYPVRFVGTVDPSYQTALATLMARMRRAGVDARLVERRHTEVEGLAALASARCALLPYPRHTGMSRVLLEAVSVGTPVVATRFGMMGALVQRHHLGLAVRSSVPSELRAAIDALARDEGGPRTFSPWLSAFAAAYSRQEFERRVLSALHRLPVVVAQADRAPSATSSTK
jgi:glycosyltransferase involved in cell wall biosynthesis